MLVLLAFCFGCVAGSLTTQHWAKIRRAGGAALAVVAGTPPAPAAQNLKQAAPTIGTVLKNFGQFFGWCFRNWIPIVGVCALLFLIAMAKGCSVPGPFHVKSKEELRLEAEIAVANAATTELRRQRDLAIADAEREAALRQAQIAVISAQGRNEIAEATPEHEEPIDPGLSAAWRHSLERLCIYPGAQCDSAAAVGSSA